MSRRIRRARALLTAWMLGIRDGWEQPLDLSSSTNVDHLDVDGVTFRYCGDVTVYDALDAGINLGQILRAGRRSQAWVMGWHHVSPWRLP